ncbi:hypothetical protein PspTeo4_02792 [Pseudomonas sp. Teo4]|nr:hypothetical protein [Pseudomonas sp. Teo4]
MSKAPGCASIPSAHTTLTTASWWIHCCPAGWPSWRAGWRPLQAERLEVEFEAPDYAAHYQPLCSTAVQFGAGSNQLRLSKATLSLANPHHCPSTWQHLLQLCEAQLLQRTRIRSLGERITHLLGPLLNGGREPDLEEVALHLQLPSWTLRRKLAEEGTGFRSLLNDTRRDLAETYIRDTELAFGEIAYLLGFASAEAFQRAFKRWTGLTPGRSGAASAVRVRAR